MRVLLISQGFPKDVDDATAPFMASIVGAIASRGHTVDVVLPFHPDFRYPARDAVCFFPYRYSPVARFAPWGFGSSLRGTSHVTPGAALLLPGVLISLHRSLSRLLAAHPYDVVHAHWLLPNAWVAVGPAARRGVPLVVTLHGSDIAIAERARPLGRLAHRTLTAAGAITAVSDDLRARAERLGADPAKTATLHLGVDTRVFAPRLVDARVRARLGASADALLVVAVGRLVEKKGFRYLIEAASRVEGAHVAVVGGGDGRSELAAAAATSGASVTFTGELDHADVADAVAAADVVAVPSVVDTAGNVDGLPNTLLEALSSGRPVLASAIAGIPEVVADRANGLLVPEKDVDALVRALTELRDDPELRDRLGREARGRAVHELGWDVTAEAFERAYVTAGARL